MKSLLSYIILFGVGLTYASATEASSISGGLNIQTNFCTPGWINGTTAEGIRNEARINDVFEINRPCNSVTRNTPLLLAIEGGAPRSKIEALIESGADVLTRNADGDDAVLFAKRYSSPDVYDYVWVKVTETEGFQALVLNAAINSLAEEAQANFIIPEGEDSDASQEDTNTSQSDGGYYNKSLVDRVTADYFREAYEDHGRQARGILINFYTDFFREDMNDYYQNQVLGPWRNLNNQWYKFADGVEETFEEDKDPWHRNAPVGIYMTGDFRFVLKSLFTQQHNASSGRVWSTNFETQVGLGGGLTAGYAFAMSDDESFRIRLEGGYTRRQIAGNRDHTSEFHQSFADLNMNQYEGNVIFDLPKVFDNANNWSRDVTVSTGFGLINVDPNLTYVVSLEGSRRQPNTFHLEGDNSLGVQWIFGVNRRLTSWINLGIEASFMKFWEDFTSSDHAWVGIRDQMQTYNARISNMSGVDVAVTGTIYFNKLNRKLPWLRD